jgi:hypothetical protein
MLEDTYTEITNQSWFGRLGGAIIGIVFGVIITIAAIPLLFWNEGRAVRRYKALKEGAGVVISVTEDKVDPANEGKLIHITGLATTEEVLKDGEFGISSNAIKLKRVSQMYLWKEKKESKQKKKLGGGTTTQTTYSYQKVWSDSIINSGNFKKQEGHVNPESMAYTGKQYVAKNVTLGVFNLSRALTDKINSYEELDIQDSTLLPAGLQDKLKIHNNSYYFGENPGFPEIGDIKITFKIIKPLEVSIVSRQIGETFEAYNSKAGGQIELLQVGTYSAENMFEKAEKENSVKTWILRFVGFLLMFVGFGLVFRPLSVLADILPILGNMVGAGVFLVALVLAAAFSLLTISVAWLVYRPLLGISLLVVTGILVFGLKWFSSQKKIYASEVQTPG